MRPNSFIDTSSQIIQSFLFFTNLTGLLCIIWHFPLWWMGISGYEAIILILVLPLIMVSSWIKKNLIKKYCPTMGILLMVGSKYVDLPEYRLIVVGVACLFQSFSVLDHILNTTNGYVFSYNFLIGLALSTTLKMYYQGNNPLWPIMNDTNGGWNLSALIIGLVYGVYMTSLDPTPERQDVEVNTAKNSIGSKITHGVMFLLKVSSLGALFFSTHQLLTDPTTIIYWGWEGYNTDEPLLFYPWNNYAAQFLISFIFFGLIIFYQNINMDTLFSAKLFTIVLLSASTFILTNDDFTNKENFMYGGIPYYLGIVLSYPFLFSFLFDSETSNLETVLIYSISFFFYILFTLANIWTVAYAFVPYGHVLRESLPLVLIILTAFICLGIIISKPSMKKSESNFNDINLKATGISFMLCSAWIYKSFYENNPFKNGLPKGYHADEEVFTAGIWTVHFGLDNNMWASEKKMARIIEDMELDIVGLLETDTQRTLMGNRDLIQTLANDLNMYYDYGPGPNKHTWGCILLSKFPIIHSEHHLLPSPVGELAPAIKATLEIANGKYIDVFVFHSGQEEDPEDRYLQAKYMQNLMGSSAEKRGAVLLSYLVTEPHHDNYNIYVSDESTMRDIEPLDDDRWCEYILYKNMQKLGYARLARGDITDTELQVGRFKYVAEDEIDEMGESLYDYRLLEMPLEYHWRFNDRFLDEGEDGHFYHVLERPHYYDWN